MILDRSPNAVAPVMTGSLNFFAGGGEKGGHVRKYDWTAGALFSPLERPQCKRGGTSKIHQEPYLIASFRERAMGVPVPVPHLLTCAQATSAPGDNPTPVDLNYLRDPVSGGRHEGGIRVESQKYCRLDGLLQASPPTFTHGNCLKPSVGADKR